MGLIQTITNALGLTAPVKAAPANPLLVSKAAEGALMALPADKSVLIEWVAAQDEFLLKATTVPRSTASELDVYDPDDRFEGLTLDHDGERYRLTVVLGFRAFPTPNPNGRRYATSRFLAKGRPQFYRVGDPELPSLPQRLLALTDVVSVLFHNATLTVQRQNDASWSTIDAQVEVQVREYILRGGQPLPERPHQAASDELVNEARVVLAERIAPAIHADGGDVHLLEILDGIAQVQMTGACDGCPASTITLHTGIQTVLTEAFPGRIVGVKAI